MNNNFIELTNDENMMIDAGGLMEFVGYGSGAYAVGNLSAAVFGTVTGTQTLVTTGVLVSSGVGLGLLAVGLGGYAIYSLFN